MDQKTEFRLLVVMVILTSFFPLKILFTHLKIFQTSSKEASSEGTSQEKLLSANMRSALASKRQEAIKKAIENGEKEYTFSLSVPPPPVTGGN